MLRNIQAFHCVSLKVPRSGGKNYNLPELFVNDGLHASNNFNSSRAELLPHPALLLAVLCHVFAEDITISIFPFFTSLPPSIHHTFSSFVRSLSCEEIYCWIPPALFRAHPYSEVASQLPAGPTRLWFYLRTLDLICPMSSRTQSPGFLSTSIQLKTGIYHMFSRGWGGVVVVGGVTPPTVPLSVKGLQTPF